MKPGDLILFSWPKLPPGHPDSANIEGNRIGLIIEKFTRNGDMTYGDEFRVLHDGETWSVPEAWCRLVKAKE